ncbi:ABC transporter substrate-binding protein [Pseudarthrobacter sp. HLT3-5]|uniref:ABC transporter substrate-binding protein n=1 Tax=Pseudarthrobacter cellobiosi TaxID=2953654 RepID=UPI00208F059A|nr:ABC transporter substrate-binding protein [Pseudarthrobacter sp. HLT3-5]MCO4273363.1 ABC transporter substrate-binding protein [Pseudarthrobacter sp. HLT3-5]
MSHPIDVGSVLGGRYKVTATVLTSHDQDLVLDGVDQVLNRPVSILVAGPDNTEQVAQSAREVATGERPGNVQVLDLGVTEATTYLITNHTSAADLLDLVVASDAPYVEPFFTDTLGSEIFGQVRSHEPEPYDDEENVDAGYINYSDNHPSQVDPFRSAAPAAPPLVPPVVPARPPLRPAVRPASGSARTGAAGAGAAAAGATAAHQHVAAPQPVQAAENRSVSGPAEPKTGAGSDSPKVSLWSEDDYSNGSHDAGYDEPVVSRAPERSDRAAGAFPSLARKVSPAAAVPPSGGTDDYYDDDEPEREPRSMRWLVGGLLAVVLIAGLVFAVTNLGSLFKTGPQAAPSSTSTGSTQPNTGSPSPNQSSAPPAAPPAIDNITRQGDFDFAATYDVDLVKAFDGNAASYWSDMEFATEGWGGLATNGVPLFVKLKNPAKVSSITLTQLGASGGNLSVFTNDRPSLDGAKLVGTNSFTSTDLTMPLAEPVEAQYVIVSIKTLPKLAAPKTRYGFGIRLAEIKIQ